MRCEADVEHEDADERDRQPERREHEVLPARLERVASSAVGDQQRGRAGGRLDQQPGDAEVVDQRQREQRGPEQIEAQVVPGARAGAPGRSRARAPARYAGETSALSSPTTATTTRNTPVAPSNTYHEPCVGAALPASATIASVNAAAAVTTAPATLIRSAVGGRPRELHEQPAGHRQRGHGDRRAPQSRRPPSSEVSPVPSSSWILALNTPGDRHDHDEVEHQAQLDERREAAGRRERGEIQPVLGHEEPEHLEDRRTPNDRRGDPQRHQAHRGALDAGVGQPEAWDQRRRPASAIASASVRRASGVALGGRSAAPRACAVTTN